MLDTAGLRENSNDPIENEGMKRAVNEVDTADLVILMMVASEYCTWRTENKFSSIKDYIRIYLKTLGLEEVYLDYERNKKFIIPVMNKIDLCSIQDDMLGVSCKEGTGIEEFLNFMSNLLKEM